MEEEPAEKVESSETKKEQPKGIFPIAHGQWVDLFDRAYKISQYDNGTRKLFGIFNYTTAAYII